MKNIKSLSIKQLLKQRAQIKKELDTREYKDQIDIGKRIKAFVKEHKAKLNQISVEFDIALPLHVKLTLERDYCAPMVSMTKIKLDKDKLMHQLNGEKVSMSCIRNLETVINEAFDNLQDEDILKLATGEAREKIMEYQAENKELAESAKKADIDGMDFLRH